MRAPKEQFDFVHEFLNRVFIDDLRAKRVLSLANATLGVITGAALAVSLIGQAVAAARGLVAKSAIKQVDRLLSNLGRGPLGAVRLVGSRGRGAAARNRRGDGLDRF